MNKKVVTISFDLLFESNEMDQKEQSINAFKQYILSSPIEYLNMNRNFVSSVKVDTNVYDLNNPLTQKKLEQEEAEQKNKLPEQISAIKITWAIEDYRNDRKFHNWTLHLDSQEYQQYSKTILPDYRQDTITKTKYVPVKEEMVDIINKNIIEKLKSDKTLIFKESFPNLMIM